MKDTLQALLNQAADSLGIAVPNAAKIESTRDKAHGDLASNIAMVCAKQAGKPGPAALPLGLDLGLHRYPVNFRAHLFFWR